MASLITYKSILEGVDQTNLMERLILVEAISLHKWKLDSPYADIVYANEQDILVIKLDLHDMSAFDKEWLVEEDAFLSESPLYFSQSDHRVSPFYKMRRAIGELDLSEYNVHSLLISNCYYLNYEDSLPVWSASGAIVVHDVGFDNESLPTLFLSDSLPEGVIAEDNVLCAKTVVNDLLGHIQEIQSWEDTDESWDLDSDAEDEGYDEEEDDTNWDLDNGEWYDEHSGELSLAYIPDGIFDKEEWTCEVTRDENGTISTDNEKTKVFSTTNRLFRYEEGHHLWVRFRWNDMYISDGYLLGKRNVLIKVFDGNGKLLQEFSVGVDVVCGVNECVKCLGILDKKVEMFCVEISIDGHYMTEKDLYILDFPTPFTTCFEVDHIKFYNQDRNAGFACRFYDLELHTPGPWVMFNRDELGDVYMILMLHNKLDKDYSCFPVEVETYMPSGDLLERSSFLDNHIELEDDEDEGKSYLQIFMRICTQINWGQGRYRVIIKFMGEKVISTFFDVGDESRRGIAKLEDTDNLPDNISEALLEETPMEKLEKLVGLDSVKKQISLYKETVEFVRKRKAMGLSGDYPSLHAVFLGNPGTGKTKVARLLGEIMKQLGLLSSGHVVFEERNTLIGPFYSNEEEKTLNAISRAQGGILFIDEAYNLYKPNDPKDPGKCVIETLLTALSDENKKDWMLLMAGYAEPMLDMLNCNQGLDSRIPPQNRYYFNDYNADELMAIADLYCQEKKFRMTSEARSALRTRVNRDYKMRDERFGNGRYIMSLLEKEIMYAMSSRVNKLANPTKEQLMTIEKEDIPQYKLKDYQKPLKKLKEIIGLSNLKKSVEGHLNMVQLNLMRAELGIPTEMPPLHMAFVGNPGTGKTMVADLMGEIYASMGLLSLGKVLKVERKDLVGDHEGETEKKTADVIRRARGQVLFIDEAYTLCDGSGLKNGYGRRALEVLLTTLSKEQVDMIVVFAGYPQEMEELFNMNKGLRSRIPYTFYFEDYSLDELMEIAREVAKKKHFYFSPAAFRMLKVLVGKQLQKKDATWGNARFITRLIASHIIPAMGNRLKTLSAGKLQNKKTLQTICKSDIPLDIDGLYKETFDEPAIRRLLKKLDALVGLNQVKEAIHNFVDVSRYMHQQGMAYSTREPLRWTFIGNTGTGKSTVAGILAELLKAMNYLGTGQLIEVKAEELYGVPEYKVDEILKSAMKRARNGLLFIDGDAPKFGKADMNFNSEALRFKLSSMLVDMPGSYAMVIGELAPRVQTLTGTLLKNGIPSFNRTLHFSDYTENELSQILCELLKKRKLRMNVEACCHLNAYIHGLCSQSELGYANARIMKEIADAIVNSYMIRISKEESKPDGMIILKDVECFVWKRMGEKKGIGFK